MSALAAASLLGSAAVGTFFLAIGALLWRLLGRRHDDAGKIINSRPARRSGPPR